MNLSTWDFAPKSRTTAARCELEDNDIAPMQASHQELALANAHDLSQYVALGYYGMPGLTLGAAISYRQRGAGAAAPGAPTPKNPRVTLWEGHARWTPGKLGPVGSLRAWPHQQPADVNAANPGSPNPIPTNFYGYYAQAAYQLWEHNEYRFNPFARYEYYTLGSSWTGTTGPAIPSGNVPLGDGNYGPWPLDHDRVWTAGANFYIGPTWCSRPTTSGST